MPLLIEDSFLPATLTSSPMTDEEFADFCAEHPDLFFEMTAEGEIIVMPPTPSTTGIQNSRILIQLGIWAESDGAGGVSDPATGFVLPERSTKIARCGLGFQSRNPTVDARKS